MFLYDISFLIYDISLDPVELIPKGRTSEKLADMFNTNEKYIREVAKIKQENPDALEDIRSGKKTITEHILLM